VLKIKSTLLTVLILAVVAISLGCLGGGESKTENFDFTGFTRLNIGSAFKLEVSRGSSFSISITADKDHFDNIEVTKEGDTLKIGITTWVSFQTLEAKVTMPDLYGLTLSGASQGNAKGFDSSHGFSLNISGASQLKGDIDAGDVDFMITGASMVELSGSAKDAAINASGSSNVKLSDFEVNNADIILSGASKGSIKMDGQLNADLSGASRLTYLGKPTMGDINTSGASTISKG